MTRRYIGVWSVTNERGTVRPVAVEWQGDRCPVKQVSRPRPLGGRGYGPNAGKYEVATEDGRVVPLWYEDPRWYVEKDPTWTP